MTILTINTGTSANKGDGDSLRSAFNKINLNFAYLSTLTGGGAATLDDIFISGATISTIQTNEDIVFDPNGVGKVRFRNTPIQFDNGNNGDMGSGAHILYTKGGGNVVGLGLDDHNSSLRIVGDKQELGALVDIGLYNGANSTWASKVYVDYLGNITAQGDLTVVGNILSNSDIHATGLVISDGGIKFPDGTIQTTTVSTLSVSYITSGTLTTGTILAVNALKFDTESGFDIIDLGEGAVEIALNSTFKYWEVDGQPTLIAQGLDHVNIIAGNGMRITTDNTATPQSITFNAEPSTLTNGIYNLTLDSTGILTLPAGGAFTSPDYNFSFNGNEGDGVPTLGTVVTSEGGNDIGEIFMGSGYGEFRSIYNSDQIGSTSSGLTYAGVEGFNYAQYGDVNFAGIVSQTPHIDSMYTVGVNTLSQITIGFTQNGQTQESMDWSVVVGSLTTDYTVNGLFADTFKTVISGSQEIKLTTNRGTVLFGNQPECMPTLLSHFHIMKEDPANVDLFLGDDNNYVKLPGSGETAYGVEIGTNTGTAYTWRFGTDGTTEFPNYTFTATNGTSGQVLTNDGNGHVVWRTPSGGGGSGNVPAGGTTGQVLTKQSNDNYDTIWTTVSGGGGNSNLSNILTSSTVLYPNTSTLGIGLANKDITQTTIGASFVRLPSVDDPVEPFFISSPNEIRITTSPDSANPITISPNDGAETTATGYLVLGSYGAPGVIPAVTVYSTDGGIDLWYNQDAVTAATADPKIGVVDIKTTSGGNGNISLRPDGDGTIIASKSIILSTNTPGPGNGSNSGNYTISATQLGLNKQIHRLSSSEYYLPPGTEGQLMYFVPETGADHNLVKVWMQSWRVMTGESAELLTDTAWVPFSNLLNGNGPSYAIFTDGAWTPSHGFTS
jgi:hypothetical protein